jgi:hypothetical protein
MLGGTAFQIESLAGERTRRLWKVLRVFPSIIFKEGLRARMKTSKPTFVLLLLFATLVAVAVQAQTTANPSQLPQRDGSHDFDFVIGDWKAHVKRLPDRLNNSNVWVEYDGISNQSQTGSQGASVCSISTFNSSTRRKYS